MARYRSSFIFKTEDFFQGKLYPAIICLLVAIAQIFALEHIIIPIIVTLAAFSLLSCNSVKPILAPLCAFLFSLSRENSVIGENGSNYYFTGWRLIALIALALFLAFSLVSFFIRTEFFRKMKERGTYGLVPLLLLCAAFIINGVGTEYWHYADILFGSMQIISFLLIYILFYHGLSDDEDTRDVAEHFAYVCALITLVIFAELMAVYITNDVIIDGFIKRENILFGWGACNTVGCVVILIPMNFYAAYTAKRHSYIYFITGTLAYLTAILSISRSALLVGTVIYVLSLTLFCMVGDKKRLFRFGTLIVIITVALVLILFNKEIATAFKSYIDRGFNDSGRFEIWKKAWNNFLINPVFGNGFHADLLYEVPMVSFIPMMAHNTIMQIFFSMGIFGVISYAMHRIACIIPFIKKPSVMKFSCGLLMFALILLGIFDNFMFHIYTVFFYSIAIALVQRATAERKYY